MKRLLTLICLYFSFLPFIDAQTNHPFELGFNGGASWEQSDVKMKKLGGGWGLTFGQMYLENKTSPIDWGWRLRYLSANAYGQGTARSNGLKYNNVLNGGVDSLTDYYHNGGFVYSNYKTHFDEFSLEVLIGLNKMRERTKVYPYIFGGIGMTKAVAKTDQLNANNTRYNYLSIDSAGNASAGDITSRLNSMYDGTYETNADGSTSSSYKFMPSVGLGIGYQFTKGFSMGIEHKMTWALNDVIDGQQWANDNTITGTNDKYHYSSIWLKFSFGRGTRTTSSSTNSNANNYTTNNNTTNTTTNTTTTTNTNGNGTTTTTTTVEKPRISFVSPNGSGTSVNTNTYVVSATITGINSISDVNFMQNGSSLSGYTYNSSTQAFSCPVTLSSGTNTFVLTATNATGSSASTTTVNYTAPVVVPAPKVTITNPGSSPVTVHSAPVTLAGSVLNVDTKSQIQVSQNGIALNTFIFNPSTKAIDITATLFAGVNTFVVSASNAGGADSKSVQINYQDISGYSTPGPVVTITTPAVSGSSIFTNMAPVVATVANVSNVSQIAVTVNGAVLPASAMMFNSASHELDFTANLIAGSNIISVSANNGAGSDSKTITINYTQPVSNPKPEVIITNPALATSTVTTSPITINSTILNVTGIGQVQAEVNGVHVPTAALSFNPSTHQLNFTTNLVNGANSITVSATNIAGSDSKTITVIYDAPVVLPKPVVTITSPSSNPYASALNSTVVTATVLNVTSSSQVNVTLNGVATPFTFNAATHVLSFTAALINGSNSVTVAGTNSSGSDGKTITINYNAPAPAAAPVVTIISPNSPVTNVSASTYSALATVLNVTAASQINVTVNGSSVPFTFNGSSHQVAFTATLIVGANTITVFANNSAGIDSKSVTLVYSEPAPTVLAPVVSIMNPASSPTTVTTSSYAVMATVMNVTLSSQIQVMVNGANVPFTFSAVSHQVHLTASLINGANTLVVTGTNTAGTDSKTATIIYNAPVVIPAPIVTITNPAVSPANSPANTYNVTATVLNVSGMADIAVSVNGAAQTFAYNSATHVVTFTAHLMAGSNNVTVSAHTASGSDSKTVVLQYTPAPPVLPPVVTITSPTSNPFLYDQLTYTIKATILNISSGAQVKFYQNNNLTTGFVYIPASKQFSFNATLNSGANWFKIVATNSAGSDSATVTIKVMEVHGTGTTDTTTTPGKPVKGTGGHGVISGSGIGTHVGGAGAGGTTTGTTTTGTTAASSTGPAITMLMPAGSTSTTVSVPVYTVEATVDVMNQANIVVKINGVATTAFSFNRSVKTLSIPVNLNMGANTVIIEATGATSTSVQTITITRN